MIDYKLLRPTNIIQLGQSNTYLVVKASDDHVVLLEYLTSDQRDVKAGDEKWVLIHWATDGSQYNLV